jgi:hypothetical protein
MAQELNLLPNPDNVPGAVSTGYQRQNTNIFAIQTGLDTTTVTDNGSSVSIAAGGVVEVNGALFKVISSVTLSKPSSSYSYWVAVTDNGDGTANFSLVNKPGTWVPDKNGYYSNSSRILNNYNTIGNPSSTGTLTYSATTKGVYNITLKKGRYYFDLRSGLGGGNGGKGQDGASLSSQTIGGAGGIPSAYKSATAIKYFEMDTPIVIKVGGNGYPGGAGGNCNNSESIMIVNGAGGGGGGGGGEATEVVGIVATAQQPGGNGGAGGNSSNAIMRNGAGGGGYIGGAAGTKSSGSTITAYKGQDNRGYFSGAAGGDTVGETNSILFNGGLGGMCLNIRVPVLGGAGIYDIGQYANSNPEGNPGSNGGGGGQGAGGEAREIGGAGGYCRIYKLD